MNLKLEIEFSKAPILQEIDSLKKQIDDMRPLPLDVEGRVMQKLRLDWNYNSNAIEGNKLSYGETVAFLMEGITAKGKPLKDHLDIRGHNQAISFLLDMVKDERPLSEADIRGLHEMILVEPYDVSAQTAEGMPTRKRIIPGEYKTTPNHVQTATGETHYYATPEETPAKMRELMEWYYEVDKNAGIHPVVVAALFHHKFVAIHPFDDGNGRLSRILMNLVLLKRGYPPVVVKMDDRGNYYSLLSRADAGENWPFLEYIIELLKWSLTLYLNAIDGKEIGDEDDIDKRIALFRIEAQSKILINEEKSPIAIKKIVADFLVLFVKIITKLKPLDELFFDVKSNIIFSYTQMPHQRISNEDEPLNQKTFDVIAALVGMEKREYSKVLFTMDHLEFRNSDNAFSLKSSIIIEFNRFKYSLAIANSISFSKRYNEMLTKNEEAKIIELFVDAFMRLFNEKQNQQEF